MSETPKTVAGMTTPMRTDAFKKLVLNAGAIVYGFDPTTYENAAALKTALASYLTDTTKTLGVTRGGGSFNVTREMRQVEADGIRYRFKGDTFVDSVDAYLSATLLELGDPNVMKAALGTADVANTPASGTATKHELSARTVIAETDYLENLCWVGDINGGGYAVIWLKNALNTSDLTVSFTDKGEATLPVEFHAYQDAVEDYTYAPFKIIYLD